MIQIWKSRLRWATRSIPLPWLCVLTALAVWLWSDLFATNAEQALRFAGTILQLLGIGTVAFDIRSKRKEFGLESLLVQAKKHLTAFPRKKDVVVHVHTGELKLTTHPAGVMAFGSAKPGVDAPIEQRVAWLESQRELDRAAIEESLKKIEEERKARTSELKSEGREYRKRIAELDAKLKSATTGTLSFSVIGLVWLAIGVTLGTVATDIAALFAA